MTDAKKPTLSDDMDALRRLRERVDGAMRAAYGEAEASTDALNKLTRARVALLDAHAALSVAGLYLGPQGT
jgi:predicted RNA-binding Zn ribbon-like protein